MSPDGGNEHRGLISADREKRKKNTNNNDKKKTPQNQDGGARDSISTVHGSQSARISHPEGKDELQPACVDPLQSPASLQSPAMRLVLSVKWELLGYYKQRA